MQPTKEWLETFEQKRLEIPYKSPIDLNEYFEKDEILGVKLERFGIGKVTIKSGKLIACDPLAYLAKDTEPFFQEVPKGKFDVIVAATLMEDDCARYAAVKVEFNKNPAVRFEMALDGREDFDLNENEYFGFNVDAGLGCFCDEFSRDAFCDFEKKWYEQNKSDDDFDCNIYDDYFAKIFEDSYDEFPTYQRSEGDWINFTIPDTDMKIPFFASGYGDGTYPVYFGYDSDGKICCAVIHFINIALEMEDYDEEDED